MDTVLLAARLALAAVFFVAAAGKLMDRDGTRRAVVDFGVPYALSVPAATMLPVIEIALGIGLVTTAAAWAAAIGSAVLLGAFSLAIAANLAQGRTPDCHCFGALSSEPIGPGALVRNAVLIALAAVVIARGSGDPGASATGWLADLDATEAIAAALAALTTVSLAGAALLMTRAFERNGPLLVRLDVQEERILHGRETAAALSPAGLRVGASAPAFDTTTVEGKPVSLASLAGGQRPLLFVFMDAGCGPCTELMPDIARWQRDNHEITAVVLSSGEAGAVRAKARSAKLRQTLLDPERGVQALYAIKATPSAVVVGPDGRIASATAQGSAEIRALALRATARAEAPAPA